MTSTWTWLHLRLRTRASNELGRLLVGDWASDAQLQGAIQDLSKRSGDGATNIAGTSEYTFIRDWTFETPATYGDDLKTARPVRKR